jgi:uncharacterized protein YndB with AHSA1/START domain
VAASFEKSVTIDAPPSKVWDALTRLELMTLWMAEPEMHLEIVTDWVVGGPILTRGFHHVRFENRGTVLEFEPERALRYTHLSSLSRLSDSPAHHSVLDFRLTPVGRQTSLTLTVSNFPTDTIEKHLNFYWRTTLGILKNVLEAG